MDSGDWPFTSYEKVAEGLERLRLDEAAFRALAKTPWVVTEKIHGAHFAIVTDGEAIRAAKRKELLAPGEDFFGHEAVLARLAGAVREAVARVRAHLEVERLTIHGELFGGGYPHPEVAPDPTVEPVQTGVAYAPSVHFCAFDVAVEAGGERTYLDLDVAREALEGAGLLFAAPLLVARFEEAVAYPLGFDSTLPARLGLPPLPAGTNKAEGIVVKPVAAVHVASARGRIRPVVKRKIAEFAEDERFHGARKWRAAPSWSRDGLVERASQLANEARLHAAISKLGRLRPGDVSGRERLVAALAEDVLAEIREERAAELEAFGAGERPGLASAVRAMAEELVALYLLLE